MSEINPQNIQIIINNAPFDLCEIQTDRFQLYQDKPYPMNHFTNQLWAYCGKQLYIYKSIIINNRFYAIKSPQSEAN